MEARGTKGAEEATSSSRQVVNSYQSINSIISIQSIAHSRILNSSIEMKDKTMSNVAPYGKCLNVLRARHIGVGHGHLGGREGSMFGSLASFCYHDSWSTIMVDHQYHSRSSRSRYLGIHIDTWASHLYQPKL